MAVLFGVAAFAACSVIQMVWDGVRVTNRNFEQLVDDVGQDVNPDAALVMLEDKVIAGMRAICERKKAEGRLGKLANNAWAKFAKELDK